MNKHCSKQVLQTANKHMKNCSTVFVIREMQFKTTMVHQFEPTIIRKIVTSVRMRRNWNLHTAPGKLT